MIDSAPGRLLFHLGGEATWNMAVDQAISEAVSAAAIKDGSAAVPTLRFYTWATPTLSLGYFQAAGDVGARFAGASKVRRSTGGGAIMHHHELTYSLTMPSRTGEHGARNDLYESMHHGIVKAFSRFGVVLRPYNLDKTFNPTPEHFLCFRRRTDQDLVLSGYKVCGSAQRRSKRAILQHGSILLGASPYASELPGIAELASAWIDPVTLAKQICTEISNLLDLSFIEGKLEPCESERVEVIERERFGADRWWSRR